MFQFQLGSIRSSCNPSLVWGVNAFQFQLGSIRRFLNLPPRLRFPQFQFQLGSIRRGRISAGGFSGRFTRFNSSLVRLEASDRCSLPGEFATFQFQLGSIRRQVLSHCRPVKRRFQFQLGSIRSGVKIGGAFIAKVGFNSSLVRLEGEKKACCIPTRTRFNSSLVRLEGCSRRNERLRNCRFNSSLVRLEDDLKALEKQFGNEVSIPAWFD